MDRGPLKAQQRSLSPIQPFQMSELRASESRGLHRGGAPAGVGDSLTGSTCLSVLLPHSLSLSFLCCSRPRIPWVAGSMPPKPSWATLPSLTCGTTL